MITGREVRGARLIGLGFLSGVLVLGEFYPPASAAPFPQAPPQNVPQSQLPKQLSQPRANSSGETQEGVLRKRAEEFYALLQSGRVDQAESYVAEDSRENFRKQPKAAFLSFRVDSVQIDPTGQQATVRTQMQVMIPSVPGPPVAMPQVSNWVRGTGGLWYVFVPAPGDTSKTPPALFNAAQGNAKQPAEELKFKGHHYRMGMIQPGQIKVARFPFTNVSDHPVTITSIETFCDCLQAKIDKKEYKPGESGEVAIEFNPKGFERDYGATILVKTDPGDIRTHLTVLGFVVPTWPPNNKPAAKGNPGS